MHQSVSAVTERRPAARYREKQLPNDLVRRLPPVHDGYERVIVDGRVLLVEAATQIVHDVLMESLFD